MKEERYFTAVLEDISSKFDLLIELVQHINNTKASQADIAQLETTIGRVENSTRALLTNHTNRIQKLELTVTPLK
jgi:hypothetical protein